MKNKFGCVEMKHKSAEKIHKIIANLSIQAELKFWKEKEVALKERINIIHRVKKTEV